MEYLGMRCVDRVYPRVCGGTIEVTRGDVTYYGLSPRVRGNPPPTVRKPLIQRSIPACAGEPLAPGQTSRPEGVYPRVCGGT